MTPQVLNCQVMLDEARAARAAYVGRPTPWGNPFSVGKDGTREEVLEKFRRWVFAPAQAELRERAKQELRGKDLICWCAPKPCHADVWLEIANEEDSYAG